MKFPSFLKKHDFTPEFTFFLYTFHAFTCFNLVRTPKKKKIQALIDTGFDGNILLPMNIFEELDLFRFQYPQGTDRGEFITGESVELLTAEASLIFEILDIEFILTVNALKEATEVLIGREILNTVMMHLDGPKKEGKLVIQILE